MLVTFPLPSRLFISAILGVQYAYYRLRYGKEEANKKFSAPPKLTPQELSQLSTEERAEYEKRKWRSACISPSIFVGGGTVS
jgi:hypothetical protein